MYLIRELKRAFANCSNGSIFLTIKIYNYFQVKPSKKLERVFFLNNNPYFHMSLCIINTKTAQQTFKLARGVNFWKNDHNLNDIKDIKVYVQFRAEKIGSYGQEVIFDFGGFPKVVKKIGVHVETEDLLTKVQFNLYFFTKGSVGFKFDV